MITLTVDNGNTSIKAGIFQDDVLLETFIFNIEQSGQLHSIIRKHQPSHSILCSVGQDVSQVEDVLKAHTAFTQLTYQTPLPFHMAYRTPQTLGTDRIAAVAGACHFFPGKACLVIDAGTCITYDFITADAQYLGGAIAPGLRMRLQAMHHFTQKLPELTFEQPADFIGDSTQSCMLSGAFYGMAGEINATIARYEERYGKVQVISCGGDSAGFDKHIKSNIFAAPFLVLYGLNKILRFHVQ